MIIKCPHCNQDITKHVFSAISKRKTKEQYSKAGKIGMLKRWGNKKK